MRLRLAALALLLPVAAACGSPDVVKQSAVEVVRRAGDKTAAAGSARMAVDIKGAGFAMTGEGVSSLSEPTATMSMTIDAGGRQVVMESRVLDGVMYLKMPGIPGPKPWLKFDLEELSKTSGVDLAALSQMRQNDPKQSLAYFEGVSDDVRADGEADVRGAHTTRYRATFNLEKARDAQTDPDAKEAIDGLIKKIGTSTIPATVWIDDEGRMRKMTYEIDVSKVPDAPAGAKGTLVTTMEMYDFGVAVDVTPPPAAETADGAEMLQQKQ